MDFAVVAHDLRTPLHVMLVHLRLLTSETLSASGRTRLGVLESQVRRMIRLLDNGATPSHDQISCSKVDIGLTIRSVVSELEALFERRGIEINWTRTGPLPYVDGDQDLLHSALLNVLINAADAMPASGAITITTRAELSADSSARTVRIEIADTGTGIAPELVSHVFDHGFTTKAGAQPRGFGLGICRRIVQMHDGQIELSSVPGHGTTVSFTLPVRRELPLGMLAPAACSL
jgi:two-component system, OmpR family, sensor histidine kinase BaeS